MKSWILFVGVVEGMVMGRRRVLFVLQLFLGCCICIAWVGTKPAAGDLFHNGGTGACQGCHTEPPQLIGSDASSTCLRCHLAPPGSSQPSGYYVASDASSAVCVQLTPGGDFCWTRKTFTWMDGGVTQTSVGNRHGHNVVALDYGFEADGTLTLAPGGSYAAGSLSCVSCHDPHGTYRRFADGTYGTSGVPIIASGSYATSPDPSSTGAVGSYRLLAGKGYLPPSAPKTATAFTTDPPAAVTPLAYNRSEAASDTRVAYGSGMSEWCQNCHPRLAGDHVHPAGNGARLGSDVSRAYATYIASGNLTGTGSTAYTSLVPFEMGSQDYALLKATATSDGTVLSGPAWNANVMCLTCHRAHASGWDSALRWNTGSTFVVYNGAYPGTDSGAPAAYAQGRIAAVARQAFYDRPAARFATYQRSLCSKCHPFD
jgi:hypothetical protein